jgi:hypothetical protein
MDQRTVSLCINSFHAGFAVFAAVVMKVAIFWDTAPCSPHMNRRFGGISKKTRWCLARLIFALEDGVDTFLRNNSSYSEYTALYPRRRQFLSQFSCS